MKKSGQTLRKVWHLPRQEKWLLLECLEVLTWETLALRLLPFRRIVPHLGEKNVTMGYQLPASQDKQASLLATSLQRVKRRLPWKCTCMIEAMAGQELLRRRNISSTLYIGVRRELAQLHFHASLRAGHIWLTGGPMEAPLDVLLTFTKWSPGEQMLSSKESATYSPPHIAP